MQPAIVRLVKFFRNTKAAMLTRLGFKSPKAETKLEKVRKEIATLCRKIDEPLDSEKWNLLERIYFLETRREMHSELLVKQQELDTLRQQLKTEVEVLENNEQWQLYGQQREFYVQSVHACTLDLEKQMLEVQKDLIDRADQELRVQREQQNTCFNNNLVFKHLGPTSRSKSHLPERFLECPLCGASFHLHHNTVLLAHIEDCSA